jgi:hypothetical protein
MSAQGRDWAYRVMRGLEIRNHAESALRVAFALGDRHNVRTGRCDPGQDTLAVDTNCSERAVRRGLAELRRAGALGVTARQQPHGKGRTSDAYTLLPFDGGAAPKPWDQPDNTGTLVRPTGQIGPTNRTDQVDQPDKDNGAPNQERT